MLPLLLTLACTDAPSTDSAEHEHHDAQAGTNDSDASQDSDPGNQDSDAGNEDSDEPPEPTGEELYLQHCSACHGADGQGNANGPGITHELHHTDDELVRVILEGKKDMEPVEISEEDARTIVEWMREQWG